MIQKKKNKTKKMTAAILLQRTEKIKVVRVKGKSVVVLPLSTWRAFEDHLEDSVMSQSRHLAAKIKKAREDIKKGRYMTLEEVKKKLLK